MLKIPFLFIGFVMFLSAIFIDAAAQTGSFHVAIVAPVIVGAEAESYCREPGTDGRFYIMSRKLKLYAIKPAVSLQAEDIYRVGSPLSAGAWQHIEFRSLIADSTLSWQSLAVIDTGNIRPVPLISIDLKAGEVLTLEFRDKISHRVLLQSIFERPLWAPQVVAWRQHRTKDPEEKKYSGHLLQQQADSGRQMRAGLNTLQLAPGKQTDLLLLKKELNYDSCIEYRLVDLNDTVRGSWQQSGHLLSLQALPGNSNYVLQMRYHDMELITSYYISLTPFWYQRWQLLLGIFMLLLITIVIGFFYWKRYDAKVEMFRRRKLENELMVMHNQLNPHFVFNSFSSITNLINTGNNSRASEYLATFSGMMRHTMTVANQPVISLAEDIDQMEQYLRIEQLRFGFCFRFDISPLLNLQQIELPPQLLQPSIENAVKHGASGLREDGEVTLKIYDEGCHLHIHIYNNNRPELRRKVEGQGYGLKFTREQVRNLQELFNESRITYDLAIDDDGAKASFFFENWLKPEA